MLRRSILLLSVAILTGTDRCQAAVIVFGDSLSDVQNLYLASGGASGPLFAPAPLAPTDPAYNPLLPAPRFPTPPYDGGRASNGPVWVETLADMLGEAPPTASLAGGSNYAWISASTAASIATPFGAPDMQTQVLSYLTSDSPAPDDLFVVWGGSNDYFFAPPQPAQTVANLSAIVSDLYAAGARRFIVPNLPALGNTPQGMATDGVGLNMVTALHNQLLGEELLVLSGLPGIEITPVDVAGTLECIQDDPSAYGLANTIDPALALIEDPSSPLFYFPQSPATVAANVDEYLFFDGVHPTSRVHGYIAAAAFRAHCVPEPAATMLGFATLGCLCSRRTVWL